MLDLINSIVKLRKSPPEAEFPWIVCSKLFEILPRIDFDVLSESFVGSGGGGDCVCVLCRVHHDLKGSAKRRAQGYAN